MSLSTLESHVLAYYLAHSAKEFSMTGRWFPYSELDFILADKIRVDVRPFGKAAQEAAKPVATFYLDHQIAAGGFSTKEQKFGGTMHQYEGDAFKAALVALTASDAILAKAAEGGPDFWQSAFAAIN